MSDRLREIEERVNAATPGPWESVRSQVTRGPDEPLASFGWSNDVASKRQMSADAHFVAHAREDVPFLLAELVSARAQLEQRDEVLALVEQALDNIARLAELNAEEPGWQVEVHRIACEAWRQAKDAGAVPAARTPKEPRDE